jgi:ATP/maltotriose-dependent transcriptional regulator MalT/DNA-binding SARP family transcriptional activator
VRDTNRTGKKPGSRAAPTSPVLPVLAKIDRPRVSISHSRPRLFAHLESLCDRRLIWLSAPAGSGKTTTVATWLQSRQATVVWYQCDEGDADIASFFHFLSRSPALRTSPTGGPLPMLAPELYGALPTFVRNFFREFCARLPTPAFIVFDNWQDVPAPAPLHELLPLALEELPRGVVCIVLSRGEPPSNVSRLLANEQMGHLGWMQIKLTLPEVAEIVGRQQRADAPLPDPNSLYELTQGWAVGLVAMLRAGTETATGHLAVDRSAAPQVLDYLTSEVFERLGADIQQFLLQTSCLQFITAPVAEALTGREDASAILDSLVRTNTFTLQRPASRSYYYHPLLRDLLRRRAAAEWSRAEQESLSKRAARILERQNEHEMAIELLLRACCWSEAAQLMQQQAPTLTRQGRYKTLTDWIGALPEARMPEWPWLTYWQGMARMAIAFPEAADTLERAYRRFAALDEALGQMLSIAALLQVHLLGFSDFGQMRPWIDVLVSLLDRGPDFPSPSVELTVLTGLFTAIVSARPDHRGLEDCQKRMTDLLRAGVDLHSRFSAGAALVNYLAVSGNMLAWRQLMPEFELADVVHTLPPALRIQFLWFRAGTALMGGDLELTHKVLDEGVQIAQDNGLPLFVARLELSKVHSTNWAGRTAEALESLARLEPQFRQAPPLMRAFYAYDRAIVQLIQGDLSAAERDMRLSYDIVEQAGYVLAKSWILAAMGEIQWTAGRFHEAGECVSRSREVIGMLPMPIMEFDVALLSAAIALEKGQRSDALTELHHALSVGRTQGIANGFHLASRILPRVLPYALEQGVEVDYCRWLIRHQGLQPPAGDVPGWPWSVRIEALGSFQVYVDEKPLRISGKAQRRPLNLLKALLLHQRGCETDTLIDRYWPDLDGDAARNAFDLALHRLRKMLLRKDAIVLAQGRVQLNRSLVWVDAFALEAVTDEDYDPPPPAEQVRRLLQLYRGPLLAGESEPWTLGPRERLRGTFLRRVAQLSDLLQASHQYEALIAFNHRVLDVEPLAEEVYRRLMQSLIAQDRPAEARQIYHRCEEALNLSLSVTPSLSTQQLYARLRRP